jgi:hypothetical protein
MAQCLKGHGAPRKSANFSWSGRGHSTVRITQFIRTICFLIVAALLVPGANAAEVNCDSTYGPQAPAVLYGWPSGSRPSVGTCYGGFITGEIQKGDFEKVRSLLAKNHPFLRTFSIRSPGGDAAEAMRIGILFRKYLIEAHASFGNLKAGGFAGPLLDSKPNDRCGEDASGHIRPHLDCGCASASESKPKRKQHLSFVCKEESFRAAA